MSQWGSREATKQVGRECRSKTSPWKLLELVKGIGADSPSSPPAAEQVVEEHDIMKTRESSPEKHISCPSSVLVHTEERFLGSRLAVQ